MGSKVVNKVSIPIGGLMLGLAALGNLVQSYGELYRNIFGVIAAIVFVLIAVKAITDFNGIKESLNNPVVASVAPTISMGIMILATYVKPYFPAVAYGIWIAGLVLHGLLIIYFTGKYILNFNIQKVFPSYFIVYVGIVVGSVTGPAFNQIQLGRNLFWFGLVSYLILLPIVLYRVVQVKNIPELAMPTIAIFAAPASLCLAGYMNSFENKNTTMIGFLAGLSLLMLVYVLLNMPKLLKLPFYPSYSAFTFPFVISGIAIKLTNGFLVKSGNPIAWLKYIVKFEEALAVILVVYVLIRYVTFLMDSPKEPAKA